MLQGHISSTCDSGSSSNSQTGALFGYVSGGAVVEGGAGVEATGPHTASFLYVQYFLWKYNVRFYPEISSFHSPLYVASKYEHNMDVRSEIL